MLVAGVYIAKEDNYMVCTIYENTICCDRGLIQAMIQKMKKG